MCAADKEDNIFAAEAWHEENGAVERAAARNQDCDYDDIDRALAPMRTFTRDPKRFHLLTTYEMRLHRKAQADLRQLRELQATRRAEQEKKGDTKQQESTVEIAPPPARQPADITTMKPQNGFVCSPLPMTEKEIEEYLMADPRQGGTGFSL